jgi:DNA polymerase sigma
MTTLAKHSFPNQAVMDNSEFIPNGNIYLMCSKPYRYVSYPYFDEKLLGKLTDEIEQFSNDVTKSAKQDNKHKIIDEIRLIIESYYEYFKVNVFGSFANKLSLPSSDIDLVVQVQGIEDQLESLRNIQNLLSANKFKGMIAKVILIGNTYNPMIKLDLTEKYDRTKVDILIEDERH